MAQSHALGLAVSFFSFLGTSLTDACNILRLIIDSLLAISSYFMSTILSESFRTNLGGWPKFCSSCFYFLAFLFSSCNLDGTVGFDIGSFSYSYLESSIASMLKLLCLTG